MIRCRPAHFHNVEYLFFSIFLLYLEKSFNRTECTKTKNNWKEKDPPPVLLPHRLICFSTGVYSPSDSSIEKAAFTALIPIAKRRRWSIDPRERECSTRSPGQPEAQRRRRKKRKRGTQTFNRRVIICCQVHVPP